MGVVHAHSWVVIDCRVPQESVIRIVSTMGTKESISYKMISHGSWSKQRERERKSNSQDTRGGERKGNRHVKNKRTRCCEVKETDGGMESEGMSTCARKRERSTSKSNMI